MGDLEENLGRRVAALRERAGLRQADLAERVGVGKMAISRLERGVSVPSVAKLGEIARALGVGLADLFAEEAAVDSRATALAAALRQVSDDDAELLSEIATLLARRARRPGT